MEKKIILTLTENGSIKIEHPNDISFMETIGILEASKAILLNGYVNPSLREIKNQDTN